MNWLIPEWQKAYKFLSVQLSAFLVVLSSVYEYLPAIQQYIPGWWIPFIAGLVIVARVTKHPEDKHDCDIPDQ